MKLNSWQAYIFMFEQLDKISKTKPSNWIDKEDDKYDTLDHLLGNFDPYIFQPGSADPAAWEDWQNVLQKMKITEPMTVEQALQATENFVKFHIDEFGFELDWVIGELKSLPSLAEQVNIEQQYTFESGLQTPVLVH
ncbi:MAG: hypothetical protein FWG68_07940 [Defluviitaleaceae bacterium]|nr:hypothetical protein [Defluviitaleaceae bacterium]